MFKCPWDKLKEIQDQAASDQQSASSTYRGLEVRYNGGIAYYYVSENEVTSSQAIDYLTFL